MTDALGIVTRGGRVEDVSFTAVSREAARHEELLEVFDRHYKRTQSANAATDAEYNDVYELYEHFCGRYSGTGLVHTPVDWIIYLDL